MDDSSWPHPEQQRKAKAANSKKINHQIDPKRLTKPHLSEHSQRGNKKRNDDAKNVTTGHEIQGNAIDTLKHFCQSTNEARD